jgi:predicted  nucleic acid-binding Zn ribbon protein
MYKWEENYQRDIDDDVEGVVLEHYGVEEVSELTRDQINEIIEFADNNEYSIMKGGFYNLMNRWEDEQE